MVCVFFSAHILQLCVLKTKYAQTTDKISSLVKLKQVAHLDSFVEGEILLLLDFLLQEAVRLELFHAGAARLEAAEVAGWVRLVQLGAVLRVIGDQDHTWSRGNS